MTGENSSWNIHFNDVTQYRVFYLPDLNHEMINESYDKLVEKKSLYRNSKKWFMITFDDGPTYVVRATSVDIKPGQQGIERDPVLGQI